MVFGGDQLGKSSGSWSGVLQDCARVAEAIAGSAGLEASFARRRVDWKLQCDLAAREIKQLERQEAAALIRLEIAKKTSQNHLKRVLSCR